MAVAACVAGEKSVAPNPIASNAYHSEQVEATPARPKMSTTFRSEKMARLNPHQLPRGLREEMQGQPMLSAGSVHLTINQAL